MSGETASGFAAIRERILVNPMKLPLIYRLGLLGLLLIALVPVPLTAVQLSGLTIILYFMMFAMSWDFVSGYTGQISFGHTLFFALGGYGSAVLNLQYGVSPALGIPAGMLFAALGGILVGVPALRLRGPYLSLITLIVPLILLQIFVIFSGTFGGRSGLTPPDPLVGTGSSALITVDSFVTATIGTYYASFLVFLLILGVMLAITRSDAGDVFTAIREDEDVVAAVGLNPAKFKIFAFVVSGAAGGLAGAMFVHTAGNPLPGQLLEIDIAIRVIIMTVIGGMGTIVGAAIGALFFALTNAILGSVPVTIPGLGLTPDQLTPLPLYFVALLVLFYFPDGIYGRTKEFVRRYEADEPPEEEPETSAVGQVVDKYKQSLEERL